MYVLGSWGMGELADEAGLVVSELAANAVTHLRGLGPVRERRIGVTFRRPVDRGEGEVVVEVHDGSDLWPVPANPGNGELSEAGRGLLIVDALTGHNWGVARRPDGPGKVVWAALARPTST